MQSKKHESKGSTLDLKPRADKLFLPVVALLTGEALEVVDVGLRSHHHLKRRDHLRAGGAVAGRAEQSTAKRTVRLRLVHT